MSGEAQVPAVRPTGAAEGLRLPKEPGTALMSPLDDDLALVLGVGRPMPSTLRVLPNGMAALAGQAALVAWRRQGVDPEQSVAFAALVSVPGRVRGGLRSVVFQGPNGPVTYQLVERPLRLEAAYRVMAADAGGAVGAVVDGIVEALVAGQPGPLRLARAVSLVKLAAEMDGFVEVMGSCEDGAIFVQGWSAQIASGLTRILVAGRTPCIAEMKAGTFAREDSSETAPMGSPG